MILPSRTKLARRVAHRVHTRPSRSTRALLPDGFRQDGVDGTHYFPTSFVEWLVVVLSEQHGLPPRLKSSKMYCTLGKLNSIASLIGMFFCNDGRVESRRFRISPTWLQ